jgi:hypothetical protein
MTEKERLERIIFLKNQCISVLNNKILDLQRKLKREQEEENEFDYNGG